MKPGAIAAAFSCVLAAACHDTASSSSSSTSSSSSPASPGSPYQPAAPEPALQQLPADAVLLLPSLAGDEVLPPGLSHGVRVVATRCIAAADLATAAQQDVDALTAAGWQHVARHGGTITGDHAPDHIQIIVSGIPGAPCALPGHYRATVMLTRPSA